MDLLKLYEVSSNLVDSVSSAFSSKLTPQRRKFSVRSNCRISRRPRFSSVSSPQVAIKFTSSTCTPRLPPSCSNYEIFRNNCHCILNLQKGTIRANDKKLAGKKLNLELHNHYFQIGKLTSRLERYTSIWKKGCFYEAGIYS